MSLPLDLAELGELCSLREDIPISSPGIWVRCVDTAREALRTMAALPHIRVRRLFAATIRIQRCFRSGRRRRVMKIAVLSVQWRARQDAKTAETRRQLERNLKMGLPAGRRLTAFTDASCRGEVCVFDVVCEVWEEKFAAHRKRVAVWMAAHGDCEAELRRRYRHAVGSVVIPSFPEYDVSLSSAALSAVRSTHPIMDALKLKDIHRHLTPHSGSNTPPPGSRKCSLQGSPASSLCPSRARSRRSSCVVSCAGSKRSSCVGSLAGSPLPSPRAQDEEEGVGMGEVSFAQFRGRASRFGVAGLGGGGGGGVGRVRSSLSASQSPCPSPPRTPQPGPRRRQSCV